MEIPIPTKRFAEIVTERTVERDPDSFALFGSGNLTNRSIESNVELHRIRE